MPAKKLLPIEQLTVAQIAEIQMCIMPTRTAPKRIADQLALRTERIIQQAIIANPEATTVLKQLFIDLTRSER